MQNHQTKLGRALAILMSVVMAMSVVLVNNPTDVQAAAKQVKNVKVSAKSVTVNKGATQTVKATVKLNKKVALKDKYFKVTAKPADESVVSVDVENPSGKKKAKTAKATITITGLKAGTTTITVASKKKKTKKQVITVTVNDTTPAPTPTPTPTPGGSTVTPGGGTVTPTPTPGGNTPTVTPTPQTAPSMSGGSVTLPISGAASSSDPAVATVDENGKVTAGTKPGTVTITGKNEKGEIVAYTVTVTEADVQAAHGGESTVSSISFDKAEYTVEKGKSVTAVVTVVPANGQTVIYTSGNESVASITDAGVIIGGAIGETTITATAGGKQATATVKVVAATVIKLTPENGFTVAIGESNKVTSSVDGVEWSSDDSSVASVDATGMVTGQSAGTATITASKDGVSSSVVVTVTEYSSKTEGTTLSVVNPIANNNGNVIGNTCLVNQDMIIRAHVQKDLAPVKGAQVKLKIDEIDSSYEKIYPIDPYTMDPDLYTIQYDNNGSYAITDENGNANITISYTGDIDSTYDWEAICPYVSFNVSSTVNGSKINDRDITIKFASVLRNGIYVHNNDVTNVRSEAAVYNEYGTPQLLTDNHELIDEEDEDAVPPILPWKELPKDDDGIQMSYNTNDYYPVQYVSSQQVPGTVELYATPYFVLPPDRTATADNFEVVFDGKEMDVKSGQTDVESYGPVYTESYSIYNAGSDLTTTTSLINVPAGLVSMSVMFNRIDISKYSKMFVDLYEVNDEGALSSKIATESFAGEDWYKYEGTKEKAVQLEMSEMKKKGILVVSIQSPGQVDMDTTGYQLTKVTGNFSSTSLSEPEMIEIVDSVHWEDVTENATYTTPKAISYADVLPYLEDYKDVDNSFVTDGNDYTFTWSVPAFSGATVDGITGNAIITATYKDGSKVSHVNYAYPAVRKAPTWDAINNKWTYYNVNELMPQPASVGNPGHIKAIMLGKDVIENGEVQAKTGGLTQKGNIAVVKPSADNDSGILFAEATIEIKALEDELDSANRSKKWDKSPLRGADDKFPLYTFVEYVPTPDAEEGAGEIPTFYALEDQYIEISGLVTASNGNIGTDQIVKFYDADDNLITPARVGGDLPGPGDTKIMYVDEKTGDDGRARLILQATEGAVAPKIRVEYAASEKYTNFKTFAGKQEFAPTVVTVGEKAVNICNLEWLDLGLAYLDSIVPVPADGVTGTWLYNYLSDFSADTKATSVVAKRWNVGFLPAVATSVWDRDNDPITPDAALFETDYKKFYDYRETLVWPENTFAGISGVGVGYDFINSWEFDKSNCSVLEATDEDYETAVITSTHIGTTKVTGSLRVDQEECEIGYYDDLGIPQVIKTVGVNKVNFNNQDYSYTLKPGGEINYTMTWIPAEWKPVFIHPYGLGVVTNQDTTVYFRIEDIYHNPVEGEDIVIKATRNGSDYTTSITQVNPTTDDKGLIVVDIPAQLTACTISLTAYDGSGTKLVKADENITYADLPTGKNALQTEGDPVVKKSSTNKVVLTFNNNISTKGMTDEMLSKLFVVVDKDSKELEISNVEVSQNQVQITLSDKTFIDHAHYTIEIQDAGVDIDGVTYVLYDIYGQAITAAYSTIGFDVNQQS